MKTQHLKPYLLRLVVVIVISIAFALIFNEISYRTQKDHADRAPHTVRLVIPPGTAVLVEAGQNPASIPSEMSFVTGDVLEVVNEDSAPHQLGPIWVPPGTTGRLVMEKADKLAYSCSFQTTQYLGLDVRSPTTFGTRLVALSFTAPTVGALLFIYSLLVYPVKTPDSKTRQPGIA
jgi:hypothetical protein